MTENSTPPQLPVPAEDEENLGPAMQVLTPKQRAFVRAYSAGMTQAQAVAAAGYSTSSETVISVNGTRLANDPKIQAALYEVNLGSFRLSTIKSRLTLEALAFDPKVRPRDRIVAAIALLDRGGFGATTQHRVDVHRHEPSRAEVNARLAAACDELNFTPEMKAIAMRVSNIDLKEQPDGSFAAAPTDADQAANLQLETEGDENV
jgi:phage terminase small subunit